jgi:hypothetical protein
MTITITVDIPESPTVPTPAPAPGWLPQRRGRRDQGRPLPPGLLRGRGGQRREAARDMIVAIVGGDGYAGCGGIGAVGAIQDADGAVVAVRHQPRRRAARVIGRQVAGAGPAGPLGFGLAPGPSRHREVASPCLTLHLV